MEHYKEGRYFIGLSSKFIRFPSIIFEMKFEHEEVKLFFYSQKILNKQIFNKLLILLTYLNESFSLKY
jgi:hypothetical protein